MPATANKLATNQLLALLQRHYIKPGEPLPGGIFIPECGWNGGNAMGNGGCDAIYVGFTTTSGRILVGHELKISRADWLNELNKPGKADAWADECHAWYLVVADPAIVHEGELPAGWGLMVPGTRSKTRMDVRVQADVKTDHTPSWKAVRSIMARQDTLRAEAISFGRQRAEELARGEIDKRVEAGIQLKLGTRSSESDLRKRLTMIEEALGVQVITDGDGYRFSNSGRVDVDDLAAVVKLAQQYGSLAGVVERMTTGYANPAKQAREAITRLDEALTGLANVLNPA